MRISIRPTAVITFALVTQISARCDPTPTRSTENSQNSSASMVRTLLSEYHLSAGVATISARLTNTSGSKVHLAHCGYDLGAFVERFEGGEWKQVTPPGCALVHVPDVVVAPDSVAVIPIELRAGPQVPADKIVGTFRIRVWAYQEPQTPLPVELITSNTFTIAP
jgi:hypothetical protein